jgi:hypothetical protein
MLCAACRFNYDLDPEYDPSQRGGTLGGAGRSGNAGQTAYGGNLNDAGGPTQGGATAGFSGSAGQSAGGSSGSAGATPNSAGAAGASGTGGALDCTSSATCQCASYNNKTYRFCTTPQFNSVAQTDCVANAMTLARVDDASENEWLLNTAASFGLLILGQTPPGMFWIGATDAAQEGTWTWRDETQFWSGSASGTSVAGLYANWEPSSPGNGSNTDCAGMRSTGRWLDSSCSRSEDYVCESP